MLDLNRYLQRIGFSGELNADVASLKALHQAHVTSIPFENIDVLLGRGIDTSLDSIQKKLVDNRRGGYCFEQNTLFRAVLVNLGLPVESLLARVLWQRPADTPVPPANHMVLRVVIAGEPWLVDVGFGGQTLRWPVRFTENIEQDQFGECYRLLSAVDDVWTLQTKLDGEWASMYEVDLRARPEIDFEVANWYTSTHPDSKFTLMLTAARATLGCRYGLRNSRLSVRQPGRSAEQKNLTIDELCEVLASSFGLPVELEWRSVLEKFLVADN